VFTIYGAILALSAFLLGFAWGRRTPDPEPDPIVYRAGMARRRHRLRL